MESLINISPSQIVTYDGACQRKWGWQTLAKIEVPPSNDSAALGTKVHGILETYLADGTLPDYEKDGHAAKVAASGLHLIPEPGSPMEIEKHFSFFTPRTGKLLAYNGLKDFSVAPEHRPERIPLIGDHKTTSNFQYAQTEETLRKDPQALVYAYDALATHHAKAVDLHWVYYQTKGANDAKRVHLRLTSEEVRSEFERIEFIAEEMATKRVESGQGDVHEFVLSLAPNVSECSSRKYGKNGCPFQHLCNLSPMQKIRAAMSGAANALARLKARKAEQEAQAPAWTQEKVPFVSHTANAPPQEAVAINPPEQQPPLTEQAPAEQPVIAAAQEKPKKGGRGKKAQPELKELPAPEAAPSPAPEAARQVVVYVNCLPSVQYVDATAILAKAKQLVNAEFEVDDFRFVDYGKGAGALQAAVRKVLAEIEGSYGVYVDTSSPEGQIALPAFLEFATFVVRGVR